MAPGDALIPLLSIRSTYYIVCLAGVHTTFSQKAKLGHICTPHHSFTGNGLMASGK